jgi:hypothetical protein
MDVYRKALAKDLYKIYLQMGVTKSEKNRKRIIEVVKRLENPKLMEQMATRYRQINDLPPHKYPYQ